MGFFAIVGLVTTVNFIIKAFVSEKVITNWFLGFKHAERRRRRELHALIGRDPWRSRPTKAGMRARGITGRFT